jgi:hypothetical protein
MVHDLSRSAFRLDAVEEFAAGDSRTLAYQVTDENGNGIDISTADISWRLVGRAYEDRADAVLDDSDAGVTVTTTASGVDATIGEFEVQLGPDATAGLWGSYTQVPSVEQLDGSTASWVGEVTLTA